MRKLLPFFLIVVIVAALAGWQLNISRLFPTFQPISVVLSIMAAAIFVRLNRGMPTIDWKSLTGEERNRIAERMVAIAGDYVVGLGFSGCSIATLVCLVALGPQQATSLSREMQVGIVSWFIFSLGASTVWMGYVIWRDYDIMLLQKQVIEEATLREQRERDIQAAKEKSAAMKASSVTVAPTPVRPFQSN
ncbi:hypothetical protein [Rhizobium sp. BR 249]|uniref:hypothetical protein n=1 Tax=Rhizobium sp. BR 249 TaxID=3040011 RepID=UPI0039BEDDE2